VYDVIQELKKMKINFQGHLRFKKSSIFDLIFSISSKSFPTRNSLLSEPYLDIVRRDEGSMLPPNIKNAR
jgi:hypothetical protein